MRIKFVYGWLAGVVMLAVSLASPATSDHGYEERSFVGSTPATIKGCTPTYHSGCEHSEIKVQKKCIRQKFGPNKELEKYKAAFLKSRCWMSESEAFNAKMKEQKDAQMKEMKEQMDAQMKEQRDAQMKEQRDAQMKEQMDAQMKEQMDAQMKEQIENLENKIKINPTKMKTINSQGITRTMYCKPKCTLGSPMLQSNSTGIDMGIPLVVYDGISEALIEAFGGENPFKKSQIIKLGISGYKEIAKTINDPNIKKAMAMPAEQLKQIKTQQRKTQANSNDNSGGSTAGGVAADGAAAGGSVEGHDHHHEEEDPGVAPDDPGDRYAS
jgi:hypothetical protein